MTISLQFELILSNFCSLKLIVYLYNRVMDDLWTLGVLVIVVDNKYDTEIIPLLTGHST